MPKLRKDTKTKKKQKQEKYNAENEIIIGVTTVNKEKRVDNKRSTRANHVNKKNNRTSQNRKRTKDSSGICFRKSYWSITFRTCKRSCLGR